MCGDDEAALRLLSSLRDKSLIVTRSAGDGGARFAMLDTIREYALERLRADGGDAVAHRRFAEHFVEVAETAHQALSGPEQGLWLRRLADDYANFGAALAWARDAGEADLLLRTSGALWRFWLIRGHVREGREWIGEALRLSPSEPTPALGRALYGGCALAVADGDLETGVRSRSSVSASLARSTTTPRWRVPGRARERRRHARLVPEASALLEQAAEHATRAQAWRALASTMSNLGYLSLLQGDAVRGIEQCREAARRFEELGIRDEQAGAAVNVAIGLLRHGDDAAALGVVSDSLATYAELGHEDGVSYCLDVVAAGILRRGDASSAGRRCRRATREHGRGGTAARAGPPRRDPGGTAAAARAR